MQDLLKDLLTLYKLIILYMLSLVDFPLTKAQIGDFILEKEYTDFLTLQQTINELIDAGLVTAKSIRNRTHLSITGEGLETLNFFRGKLNEGIRKDVDGYFRQHKIALRNEVSVLANYYKNASGEYDARLVAKDHGADLVNITLTVPSEDTAISICDNWQKKNEEIYQYLIGKLF